MSDDGYFGEDVAERYDEGSDDPAEVALVRQTVDLLTELADGGPALELGIGTGRVALPLAQRGVVVHGIDLSRAMVERLRAKPGGAELPVTIGDFATTRAAGTAAAGDVSAGAASTGGDSAGGSAASSFSLVYLVFNTIMNLTSQDAQVACFANAAAHLRPGGRFLVEVGVPDLQRLPPGETVHPFHFAPNRWGFDEYDVVTQGMVSHHLWFTPEGATRRSIPFRYVWPAELDLMARMAGMRLESRWDGWQRAPFTSRSRAHVSVWRKPG